MCESQVETVDSPPGITESLRCKVIVGSGTKDKDDVSIRLILRLNIETYESEDCSLEWFQNVLADQILLLLSYTRTN